jgi:MurNAc alpha-1-phosphate uridylyltransferase
MILAAGRGERMRPLTDHTPKPLLRAGGKALIDYHIDALVAAGIRCLVVNHAHLGEQIEQHLGSGGARGCCIHYSREGEALETGGGILKAMPHLKDPFLVVNADIWSDVDYAALGIGRGDLAQLLLVDNPEHHPRGDFRLEGARVYPKDSRPALTFSGVGVYRKSLFAGRRPGRFPLAPLLREAMAQARVGGTRHPGAWMDVGTPARLRELDTRLRTNRLG